MPDDDPHVLPNALPSALRGFEMTRFAIPDGVKTSLLVTLAAFVAACGAPAKQAAPPSSQSSLLGKPAPSFKRSALDGSHIELGAVKGRVIVVKFVAKYCEPCTRTLPAIEKLHVRHPDILVVGISEDEHEAEARELASTYHLTFPLVHDAEQVLAARWRVRDLPVTYVLDGAGNVSWVGGPEKSEGDLVAAIEAAKP